MTLDFRGVDCQLCFWGAQLEAYELPSFNSLYIELGPLIIRLAPFEKLLLLYGHASFDWGSASSEHFLAASWKYDLHQHSAVYHQIAAKLGPNHPMAKLIQKELDKHLGRTHAACRAAFPRSGRSTYSFASRRFFIVFVRFFNSSFFNSSFVDSSFFIRVSFRTSERQLGQLAEWSR